MLMQKRLTTMKILHHFMKDHQIDHSTEEITEMFEHPEEDSALQEAMEWLNGF